MISKFKSKTVMFVLGLNIACCNVMAGGVDRSGSPVIKLFDKGSFFDISYYDYSLDMKGIDAAGFETGQIKDDFSVSSFTLKYDVNDQLSIALLKDTPFYAQSYYKSGIYEGLINRTETDGVMGLARYKLNDNVAIHGGFHAVKNKAGTVIPAGSVLLQSGPLADVGYEITAKGDIGVGYIVGATYEIPDYHVLVSLTYHSEISNNMSGSENGVNTGEFDVTTPQSVNLDYRFPISRKNIVFGTFRWVNWDGYNVTSPLGVNFSDIKENSLTYHLGMAHMFSENLTGFVKGSYEKGPDSDQDLNNFYGDITVYGAGFSYTFNKTSFLLAINRGKAEKTTGKIGTFPEGTGTIFVASVTQHF